MSTPDVYRRMTRGVILTTLYSHWTTGLGDPAHPRTMGRTVLETSLTYRASMPPAQDFNNALSWLEGAGYVAVDWNMDDQRNYETVTLTQKGINLYEDKQAGKVEPNVALPPRR
jgi:hypothetical protein